MITKVLQHRRTEVGLHTSRAMLILWRLLTPYIVSRDGHGIFFLAPIAALSNARQTLTTLESFLLAMVHFPKVQKTAQAELVAVLGDNRLPDFADRESLPYLDALVKELYRWNPVVPTAVPHKLMEDDVYNGYFIPKGTIVFGNAWCVVVVFYSRTVGSDLRGTGGSCTTRRYTDPMLISLDRRGTSRIQTCLIPKQAGHSALVDGTHISILPIPPSS